MLQKYIPEMSSANYFGHEGNTGEGIRWGEALGASLACMGAYQAHGSVAHPHGTLLTWAAISLGGYQVNTHGHRFVNEYHGYSEHALGVWIRRKVSLWKFSINASIKRSLAMRTFSYASRWGPLKNLKTLKPLHMLSICPKTVLADTHETFQKAARGESADPLGRTDFGTALEPPFYGVKVTGALFHTQGGLKVD